MHNDIEATRPLRLDPEKNIMDFTDSRKRDFDLNISKKDYPHIQLLPQNKIKVLDTYINLKWLLDKFGAEVRYNLMTRQAEVQFPRGYLPTENHENYTFNHIYHIATLNKMPVKNLAMHLDQIAQENEFHPIEEWIMSKPWDGIKRLHSFTQTLVTDQPEYTENVVSTWMVCAVAAAFSKTGFINQGVLVLLGPQNIGKTTWVKRLAPDELKAIKEGVFLDPNNKDSVSQIASYWLVELGELETIFGKAAIGRIKSYLTMEADLLRTPYARKPTKLFRRTGYVATVNDGRYLIDETGNRRWWTIEVLSIDFNHGLDMQQVWAETYELFKQGHPTFLPHDLQAQVNERNIDHERIDPIEEKLLVHYDWTNPYGRSLTATQVMEELGFKNPSKAEVTRCGMLLTKFTKQKPHRRFHKVPPFQLLHLTVDKE